MSSGPEREDAAEPAVPPPARSRLSVLTFQAGDYTLAVPAPDVARLVPAGEPLPEGTVVVDVVGLLPRESAQGGERRRGCMILLTRPGPGGRPVAVSASRAGEVQVVEPGSLLPIPGFLFRGENPFLGLIPRGPKGAERHVFVLAGPERLLACAGAR